MRIISNSNCMFSLFWSDDKLNIKVLRIKMIRMHHIRFAAYYERNNSYRPYYSVSPFASNYDLVNLLIICSSNLWFFNSANCAYWNYKIFGYNMINYVNYSVSY